MSATTQILLLRRRCCQEIATIIWITIGLLHRMVSQELTWCPNLKRLIYSSYLRINLMMFGKEYQIDYQIKEDQLISAVVQVD